MAFLPTSTGLTPKSSLSSTSYPAPSIGPSNGSNLSSGGYSSTPGIGGAGGGGGSSSSSSSPYSAAVTTQAGDYDNIMKQYQNLANSSIAPNIAPYSKSSDVSQSIGNLADLAQTGGYSDKDIQDIRARDTSPIRSIYSSAQQNLERSKNLSGGYSPNSAAAIAKMARESSAAIGDVTTNANAGIAQNVAQNKLSIAPSYASVAGTENTARTQVEQHNADTINQINQFNAGLKLSSLEGMKGLYGTTPALVKTFGDQALQSRSLDINQQQVNNSSRDALLRQILASFGGGR